MVSKCFNAKRMGVSMQREWVSKPKSKMVETFGKEHSEKNIRKRTFGKDFNHFGFWF
jgi:hypothetical protein